MARDRPHSDIRHKLTEEETCLWAELRLLRKKHLAFRRQVNIGPFTVDFLCRKAKLIVEVDGEHHGEDPQWSHDQERDRWLRLQGYAIMRFWNYDIHQDLESVVEKIYETALDKLPPHFLPPLGGGKRNAVTFGGGRPHPMSSEELLPPPSLATLDLPPPKGGRG